MLQEIQDSLKQYGKRPIKRLADLGLLSPSLQAVHATHLNEEDIRLLKHSNAHVIHCPESNMKLGSGIAPVPKLIKKGVPVGLGTDGCASNNDHDLFSEMDTAAKLHKVALLDPTVMDARTTLKMATIQGACAIGLGQTTGSLEKGKRADIILVDIEKPHTTPMYDPYSCLVYSAKSSDVSLVMVDGKILVQKGKIV